CFYFTRPRRAGQAKKAGAARPAGRAAPRTRKEFWAGARFGGRPALLWRKMANGGSAADLDAGQLFVVMGDTAMVMLAFALVVQPLQHFLHFGGHRYRGADGMCAVQGVVQVLDVQVDLET